MIRISVSSGTFIPSSHNRYSALQFVFSFNSAASSLPRSAFRLITVICSAPFRAHSTQIARAAPPAPSMVTCFPSRDMPLFFSAVTKPFPSVFSPYSFPSRWTTVLTAPMIEAASLSSSRYVRTFTLWGIVRFMPLMPSTRTLAIAVSRSSGSTLIVR